MNNKANEKKQKFPDDKKGYLNPTLDRFKKLSENQKVGKLYFFEI